MLYAEKQIQKSFFELNEQNEMREGGRPDVFCDVSVPVLVHQFEQFLCPRLLPHELFIGQPTLNVNILALQKFLSIVSRNIISPSGTRKKIL